MQTAFNFETNQAAFNFETYGISYFCGAYHTAAYLLPINFTDNNASKILSSFLYRNMYSA
jgi:hypothetical protein